MHKVLASVGVGTVALHYGPNGAMAENAVDGELTVFTCSVYDIPKLHPVYTEKHGISPSFALFGEEEEAFQKMRQGFPVDYGVTLHLQPGPLV